MLSSVSDLLTYIDDKQLTTELGGTLQYSHSEWITFRNVCFFCPYCRACSSFLKSSSRIFFFLPWEKQISGVPIFQKHIIQRLDFLA